MPESFLWFRVTLKRKPCRVKLAGLFYWQTRKVSDVKQELDLETMSLGDLEALRQENATAINTIQDQLDNAKLAGSIGSPVNANWFCSAKSALRHKRLLQQRLNETTARRRKAAVKAENIARSEREGQSFKSAFMKVVRENVSEADYMRFVQEANALCMEDAP